MIEVDFQHWQYNISEVDLIKNGSPHNKSTASQALFKALDNEARLIDRVPLKFTPLQILCGNEAFPESAIADPLADLEVWNEWKRGIRSFPYSGQFSRLNLINQESKTSSNATVGVVGEIMTGLLAQAGINPWVLARVIRNWPDFIFYCKDETYAFVESKAFTNSDGKTSLNDRVPYRLLSECLVDAVQQINADPFVVVWGAFTQIVNVDPMAYKITFLEVIPDKKRRANFPTRAIPEKVIDDISEQCVSIALSKVCRDEEILAGLKISKSTKKNSTRLKAVARLSHIAKEHIESMLNEAGPKIAISSSRGDIESKIENTISEIQIGKDGFDFDGKRLQNALSKSDYDIRRRSDSQQLYPIRKFGERDIVIRKLSDDERQQITNDFKPNWKNACNAYETVDNTNLYRCGGTLIGIKD